MTLIELTVVVTMIISLISSLFFSASFYKEKADKASCIVQMSGIQKALRSYQNFNNLSTGDTISKSDLIGPDKALEKELFCPHSNGDYSFRSEIPAAGLALIFCSDYDVKFGSKDPNQAHTPIDSSGW